MENENYAVKVNSKKKQSEFLEYFPQLSLKAIFVSNKTHSSLIKKKYI